MALLHWGYSTSALPNDSLPWWKISNIPSGLDLQSAQLQIFGLTFFISVDMGTDKQGHQAENRNKKQYKYIDICTFQNIPPGKEGTKQTYKDM